jgi:hypothetical protein
MGRDELSDLAAPVHRERGAPIIGSCHMGPMRN